MLEKIKLSDDPIIFHLIRKIMKDEVKYQEDLKNLLDDINMI